jgi:hypothetical protein
MAISASDPRYRTELEPPEILAMRAPLCAAYSRPASAFGCKGNLVHSSGYHRSFNWITQSPDSRFQWNDYSITQALDNTNLDRNACSAADFVPGEWGSRDNRLRVAAITGRLLAAAQRRDPAMAALREFAGTLNGTAVVTYDLGRNAFKSPFDSSHLDHVHLSFWRSRARSDHAGLVRIMLGDDDVLTPDQQQQLTNIHDWLFDFCRGLVAADEGTPHIKTYVPNQILKELESRPGVVLPPIQLSEQDRAAIVADLDATLGPRFEAAAERAVRKVLGAIDGASPPA